MNDKTAIKIRNVKKQYRLGQIGGGTLQGDLQTWWARKRGKEDPNSKIDSDKRLIGQTFMALNGIDLVINSGEAVGIIGKNGAGKSTLLKILCRVTAPTEGSIDIFGRITSMLEVGTGFHGEMTGRENVYMNGAILGMTKGEIDSKIDQIIEFSEVGDFIDTPVKRYSSGMYVKLAFSVAAHLDSEIMIMDEVLAVGDMAFQQKCLKKMSDSSRAEGKTVLYVSHNMNTIRKLCTRCIVLDEGKIIFDGDVDTAISIYSNQTSSENKTVFDLSLTTTKGDPNKIKAKLINLELTGKKTPVYDQSDFLLFKSIIVARKSIPSLHYRLEFRYLDGNPIGTIPDCNLHGIEQNETKEYNLKFPLSLFAQGHYKADIVLFEIDEFGNSHDIDIVLNAFEFDVIWKNGIVWNDQNWGHIVLPEAQLYE